uniref:E3 ubiquitin-protein ligase Nedd-4 n=1 Tax=Culex pipiens TaxID=7175 RepID=A0A8D7ZSE1_CULPI
MATSSQDYGYLTGADELNNEESPCCRLRIKVIAGQQLAKKDIFGASDPYVRIDLNTIAGDENIDSVLTKTKKKTLNPRWNEEFVFRVKPNEHKLVFQVFDENRLTRDDFLGMVELSLAQLPKETEGAQIPPKSYPLRPRRSVGYVWVFVAIFICYFWLTTFICCFFGFFGWIFWTERAPPGILTPTRTPHTFSNKIHTLSDSLYEFGF